VELYQGDRASYTVDVNHLPKPQMLDRATVKKGPPIYLSYVNGFLHRDLDWKSCENRVKGILGAQYRKVTSPEQEAEVLKSWGVEKKG
jgi:ribonuclease HI